MKNINKYINVLFISLGIFCTLQLPSCKIDDIETYKSTDNALWFDYWGDWDDELESYIRFDTTEISATFFPGKDSYTHYFKINLIGSMLSEPKAYKIELVDSLSNKEALKYIKVPKIPLFGADVVSDSLAVVFQFTGIPEGFRGRLVYDMVESDFFRMGFKGYNRIIVWVNNIISKPLWWKAEITDVYLGKFSPKKFEEFVRHTGKTTLEGVDSFNRRKICLDFKKHVETSGLLDKDENGNEFPMEIPIS